MCKIIHGVLSTPYRLNIGVGLLQIYVLSYRRNIFFAWGTHLWRIRYGSILKLRQAHLKAVPLHVLFQGISEVIEVIQEKLLAREAAKSEKG